MTKPVLKKLMLLVSLPLFLMTAGLNAQHEHSLCSGIIEENDWQIPVTPFAVGGLSQQQFNNVLDQFENHFSPVVSRMGARLEVRRKWSDSTVNASAMQSGNTYIVNMYGGLARHAAITADGFMLVVCHELGHHIGGAPKKTGGWYSSEWASNEGQADYYASLRCLREVWSDRDNFNWYESATIDTFAKESCELTWNTQEEEILCMRTAMAGHSVASLFKSLRYESKDLRFDTPDNKVVSSTYHSHPDTQCRMDTYYQGSLCVHNENIKLSDSNPAQGTCNGNYTSARNGSRPRCWYKP